MLQKLRHEKILKQLEAQREVKVTELARSLNTSESTIRRDIVTLDQAGKLKKVFGGAVPSEPTMMTDITSVSSRDAINTESKERIAKYAATLIEDNDFVYLDSGTTTYRMIKYIENKNAKYVTNGIVNAGMLVKKGFEVYLIGGMLRPMTEATVGTYAISDLEKYNFTKCFMGTNGIELQRGFSTPEPSEAAMKRAVIRRSGIAYILADNTKFGVVSSVSFANIKDAYVITDNLKDETYIEEMNIKKIV